MRTRTPILNTILLSVTAFFLIGAGRDDGQLPNAQLTPGAVRTTDANDVCHSTTKQFRHTTQATKKRVCAAYGITTGCPGPKYELDHLISLELGGADTEANLWPQPYEPRPGAHEKDQVENYLHRQVCSGRMELIDAQHAIRTNWLEVYDGIRKR